MSQAPTHIWIDCDAGVDDAQGLLLALAEPGISICGISCVAGNVDIEKVLINVARVLKLCDRQDIPLYRGAAVPLLRPAQDGTYFHGLDGLGDVPEVAPRTAAVDCRVAPGTAAAKLLEAAEEQRGQLTVIALGPLTNLALACHLDPAFPSKVARLVVMGSSEAVGNITACAEFNFLWDPDSAAVVLRAFPRATVVSWDCCTRNTLAWSVLQEWEALGTPKAVFISAILQQCNERAIAAGETEWISCDPLAVAVALRPQLVATCRDVFGEVETVGTLTSGMCVYDFRTTYCTPRAPNVELIGTVDIQQYEQMLRQSLL